MMKLYRFEYSCYARKVQMVLDLIGAHYQVIDVPYGDRTELAELTGGYILVPVLVTENGEVITDSRNICRKLTSEGPGSRLVPSQIAGPVWAYADWCDGPLEDVMFRIASPHIRRQFARAADRALFTFIKERKFGPACVDQWERDHDALIKKASELLAPTLQTLESEPFIFGSQPTLADAALFGQLTMLSVADSNLPSRISEAFVPWIRRLEQRRLST